MSNLPTPDPNSAAVADETQPDTAPLVPHAAPKKISLTERLLLRNTMRELWAALAMKLLGNLAYGIMSGTLVLWLSSDMGKDDQHAGFWAAAWTTCITFVTVLVGSLTDAIGLRKAFLLGIVICIFSRFALTASTVPWIALGLGLMPLAVGEALGTPVVVAAMRRYARTEQRSFAFSLSYAVMNIGFFVSAVIFDAVRRALGEHGHLAVPVLGELSTYRVLFLISFGFELVLLPIMWLAIRPGAEAIDEAPYVRIVPEEPRYPGRNPLAAAWLSMGDVFRTTMRIFAGLWRQPGFYKFLAFLGFAAFVRLIFVHLTYTYPKFAIRELGAGSPVGKLGSGLNSLMIIFLVPVVGVLTEKVSAYKMVMVGSVVAAASVYFVVMPPAWYAGLANGWLGNFVAHWYLGVTGAVNPWYVSIFLFIVLLSIGESIYSPRLYEYAAAIAPKGQEASYMSLSLLPFFLAKLGVTSFSGVLLAHFCPENGPRHSTTMWLLIALTTSIAPVGLIAFRNLIRAKEAGRE